MPDRQSTLPVTTRRVPGAPTFLHELKCWPEFFHPMMTGEKTFEVRYDDRAYEIGDLLVLREWCPKTENYTGRVVEFRIIYVLRAFVGLAPGWVALGVQNRFGT